MQATITRTTSQEQLDTLKRLGMTYHPVIYKGYEFPLGVHLTYDQVKIIAGANRLGFLRFLIKDLKLEDAIAEGIQKREPIWLCKDDKAYYLSYAQGEHLDYRCWECDSLYTPRSGIARR